MSNNSLGTDPEGIVSQEDAWRMGAMAEELDMVGTSIVGIQNEIPIHDDAIEGLQKPHYMHGRGRYTC
jgi:hypothetical protein